MNIWTNGMRQCSLGWPNKISARVYWTNTRSRGVYKLHVVGDNGAIELKQSTCSSTLNRVKPTPKQMELIQELLTLGVLRVDGNNAENLMGQK
jgi:hypothetical protein